MKTSLILIYLFLFVFADFCSAQSNAMVSSSTIEKGLIVYFDFNGNAISKDPDKHTGMVKRAKLCKDKNGKENNAYCFNGSDNYIQAHDINELENINAITVCAWINPSSYDYEYYTAWISKTVNQNYSQFRIGFGKEPEKKWGMTVYDTTWNEYNADSNIPLNEWSFVVFTADVTTGIGKAYLNGKEVGSWNNIKKIPFSKSPLYIGFQEDDKTIFDGAIDEVRIYNRALNSDEIKFLYNL